MNVRMRFVEVGSAAVGDGIVGEGAARSGETKCENDTPFGSMATKAVHGVFGIEQPATDGTERTISGTKPHRRHGMRRSLRG